MRLCDGTVFLCGTAWIFSQTKYLINADILVGGLRASRQSPYKDSANSGTRFVKKKAEHLLEYELGGLHAGPPHTHFLKPICPRNQPIFLNWTVPKVHCW